MCVKLNSKTVTWISHIQKEGNELCIMDPCSRSVLLRLQSS